MWASLAIASLSCASSAGTEASGTCPVEKVGIHGTTPCCMVRSCITGYRQSPRASSAGTEASRACPVGKAGTHAADGRGWRLGIITTMISKNLIVTISLCTGELSSSRALRRPDDEDDAVSYTHLRAHET